MNKLKYMKESLIACAESQMCHLETVDAKELGEVIDMIKDLEEAIYYRTITEAMNSKEYSDYELDEHEGKMYYMGPGNKNRHTKNHEYEKEYPVEMRDYREGRSPASRKMYMENKEIHADKATQMRELEKYMSELTQDLLEMIENSSADERQYMEKKLTMMASKIGQMNG
jgi:hypothetical protein